MMSQADPKTRIFIVSIVVFLMFFPRSLYAYIDPGTTSIAFSALGYVFSMALLGIAFFIRPLKYFIKWAFGKLSGKGELVEDEENQHGKEMP